MRAARVNTVSVLNIDYKLAIAVWSVDAAKSCALCAFDTVSSSTFAGRMQTIPRGTDDTLMNSEPHASAQLRIRCTQLYVRTRVLCWRTECRKCERMHPDALLAALECGHNLHNYMFNQCRTCAACVWRCGQTACAPNNQPNTGMNGDGANYVLRIVDCAPAADIGMFMPYLRARENDIINGR